MPDIARKKATYDDLFSIPDNMTGEIIAGELIVTPRPSRKHGFCVTALGTAITGPYQFGQGGGPGGWVIIIEPEIGLGENIVVPDLAGWKRARFPFQEESNWITVVPNWIGEILSPSTLRNDKVKKMPLYAQYGVEHIWLVDPSAMTLDAFRLESGRWLLLGSYADHDQVRVEPFPELPISLDKLWLDSLRG